MKVEGNRRLRQRHGTLRDRLIAHLPRYARFASALPWLFNLRDQVPLLARWNERLLGFAAAQPAALAARHPAPRGRRAMAWSTPDRRWRRKGRQCCGSTPSAATSRPRTRDAVRVLQAAGYAVPCRGWRRNAVLRPPYLASGMPDAQGPRRARWYGCSRLRRARHRDRRPGTSCLLSLRDGGAGHGAGQAARPLYLSPHLRGVPRPQGRRPAARRRWNTARPIKVHGLSQKAFGVMQPVLECSG